MSTFSIEISPKSFYTKGLEFKGILQMKTQGLKGKTALVTGGAKRIGQAICLALAHQGVSVIIHYNTSQKEAEQLKRALLAKKVKVWTLKANLKNSSEVKTLIARARQLSGKLHILINNASIFPENKILDVSEKDLTENFQVNAFAPLLLSNAFSKLKEAEQIINLEDSRITSSDRIHAAYDLSKKTLHEITKCLAFELAPKIRVNGIGPGLILPPPGKPMSYLKKLKHTSPLQTWGSPEDIAHAVIFLLKNSFITGQLICVDGGRHLKGMSRG